MHNDTFWYIFIVGRSVLTGGTYLSALGSQQGILISESTLSQCERLVWKKTVMLRESMQRAVGGAL